MKQVALGISRLLARSLAVLTISGLLMSWMPLGWVMAQTTPVEAEDPAIDHSLDSLWNQTLDDPTPQVRPKTINQPAAPAIISPSQPKSQVAPKVAKPAETSKPVKADNKPQATQVTKPQAVPATKSAPEVKQEAKKEASKVHQSQAQPKQTETLKPKAAQPQQVPAPIEVAQPAKVKAQKPKAESKPSTAPKAVEPEKSNITPLPTPETKPEANQKPEPAPKKIKKEKAAKAVKPVQQPVSTPVEPNTGTSTEPAIETVKPQPVKKPEHKTKPAEVKPQASKTPSGTETIPTATPHEAKPSQKTPSAPVEKQKKPVKTGTPETTSKTSETKPEKPADTVPATIEQPQPATEPAKTKTPKPKKVKAPKQPKQKPGSLWQPVVETNPTGQPLPAMPLDLPVEEVPPELKSEPVQKVKQPKTKPVKTEKPAVKEDSKKPEQTVPKAEKTEILPEEKQPSKSEQPKKQKAAKPQKPQPKPQKEVAPKALPPESKPATSNAVQSETTGEPNAPQTTVAEQKTEQKTKSAPKQKKEKTVKQSPVKQPKTEQNQPFTQPTQTEKQESKTTQKPFAPANADQTLAVPLSAETKPTQNQKKEKTSKPKSNKPTKAVPTETLKVDTQPSAEMPEKTVAPEAPKSSVEAFPKPEPKPKKVKQPKPVKQKTIPQPKTEAQKPDPTQSPVKETSTENKEVQEKIDPPAQAEAKPKPTKSKTKPEKSTVKAEPTKVGESETTQPAPKANEKSVVTETKNIEQPKQKTQKQKVEKVKKEKPQKTNAAQPTKDTPVLESHSEQPEEVKAAPKVLSKTAPQKEEKAVSPKKEKQPKKQKVETEPKLPTSTEASPASLPVEPAQPVEVKQPIPAPTEPVKPVSPEAPATPPVSDNMAQVQKLTGEYVSLLGQWQQSTKKQGLEPILNKGQEAAVAILKVADNLSEEEFKALNAQLPGYLMIRNKILVIAPQPEFFLGIAKQKGKPVDIAFFDLMNQTLNGYWPTTMEQLDDLSGCSRFGSGELVRLYGGWKTFMRQFPNAYQQALQDPNLLLLHDIEDQLLNSGSACEGPESVIQEFEQFVTTYPKSELTPKLKKRIEDLKQGKSDMSFKQGVKYRYEK